MYDVLNLSKRSGVNYSTLKRFMASNGESTRMSNEALSRVKKEAFEVFKQLSKKIDNRIEMRNKSKPKQWIVSLDLDNGKKHLTVVSAVNHQQACQQASAEVENKVISSTIRLKQ